MGIILAPEAAGARAGATRPSIIEDSRRRVVIIARRGLLTQCLAQCLGQELLHPVAAFADVASWKARICATRASVIILGELGQTRHIDDEETVRELTRGDASVPVIILGASKDTSRMTNGLRCGARGYIPIDTPLEIAVEVIRLVLAGGLFIPANIIFSEPDDTANWERRPAKAKSVFTERETAVVESLRQGKANKLIASELHVSESTVKVHLHNVMRKLHVSNRTEAVIRIAELAAAHGNALESVPTP